MSLLTAKTAAYAEPTDVRWSELERWTLEACVLRAEGREAEAVRVLQERMPGLIREWSVHCRLSKPVIQERLRRMFADKQDFVARGLAQRRLITSELIARGRDVAAGTNTDATVSVANRPVATRPPGPVGLRQRVPLSDVVGMLDGLAEAEREARREAIWPLRSPATFAAAQL